MFVDDSRDLSAIAFAHCTAASFLVRSGRQTRADREDESERGTLQQQEKQPSTAATDEKIQVKTQTSLDHYPILMHQHTEDTHRDRVFVFYLKNLQRHLRVLVSSLLNASKIFPLLSIIPVSSFCLFLAPLLALLLPFWAFHRQSIP
jgi:hypothetical protein